MPRIPAPTAPLFLVLPLAACLGGGPAPASGHDAALRAAIAAYDAAWLAKDTSAVGRIAAPGYLYFNSVGGLDDRAAMLAFLADTGYALTLSRRSEVQVTLAGPVARVSSRWEGEGRYRGEPVLDDQTCGMTWIEEEGAWRLFTEHCVNRPRPGAAPDSAG